MLYFKISIFTVVNVKNYINLPQKVKIGISFLLQDRMFVFYGPLSDIANFRRGQRCAHFAPFLP